MRSRKVALTKQHHCQTEERASLAGLLARRSEERETLFKKRACPGILTLLDGYPRQEAECPGNETLVADLPAEYQALLVPRARRCKIALQVSDPCQLKDGSSRPFGISDRSEQCQTLLAERFPLLKVTLIAGQVPGSPERLCPHRHGNLFASLQCPLEKVPSLTNIVTLQPEPPQSSTQA